MATPSMAAESSTLIRVEVLPGGDAHWTTEKMIPLDTKDDVAGWDATASRNNNTYRAQFEAQMKDYVAGISASVGRPMSVENVNVTIEKSQPYVLSGNSSTTYGVIRYEFTWTGFAEANGDALDIGDSFINGFMLNQGDMITFILPSGYDITSISPTAYDEKKGYQPQVTWRGTPGINNSGITMFTSGEPSVTMQKIPPATPSVEWWVLIPVALVSAALGFGAAYVLPNRRSPPAPLDMPPGLNPMAAPDAVSIPDAGVEMPEELPDLDSGRYMSDEERVIMFLEEAGGQMFQSDLVKKTDFSKSKLSMVLSQLKEKGAILKIKKGKENLIRLNKPSGDNAGPAEPEN